MEDVQKGVPTPSTSHSEPNHNHKLTNTGNLKISQSPSKSTLTSENEEPKRIFSPTKMSSFILSRTYSQFCACEHQQNNCPCTASQSHSLWSKLLPRNASYWPTLKISVLVFLGSIPWIFILVYIIFNYI
ncbi:UNVERIFIED_CONTAM: hypothetical protein RMT77_011372 [Armadillidium vulgare]